jgi:hypothetical protein
MKFLDALKIEMKKIEEECMDAFPYLREDFTDMMICIRFEDGRKHFIFPNKEKVMEFSKEIEKIILKDLWEKTKKNYDDQILEQLIDEKEFQVE